MPKESASAQNLLRTHRIRDGLGQAADCHPEFAEFTTWFRDRDHALLLYGGAARDFVREGKNARPRDFDFVFEDDIIDEVADRFSESLIKKNRFGGIQLKFGAVAVDCWPLHKTWAFEHGGLTLNSWRDLAYASVFDVDGIVIRLGKQIEIESAPFDEAARGKRISICHSKTLDRTIAVFRVLTLARKYNFSIHQNVWEHFRSAESWFETGLFLELTRRRYRKGECREFIQYCEGSAEMIRLSLSVAKPADSDHCSLFWARAEDVRLRLP